MAIQKQIKVAVVIPTHFDVHSSLNNLLKVYRYLIKNKNIEATIFTDSKNNVKYRDFKIEKINGIDYKTVWGKILFVLGLPRFYYTDLVQKLKVYDVIESSNPEFYGFAYQAYLGAKKYNSRLVYRTSQTVKGFYLFNITKYFIVPIVNKAYGYARFCLFSNPQAEKRCIDLGLLRNSKKSIIIGHATDTACFKPRRQKSKKNIILLSVGGLYKIKGHHLIIKALKKIVNMGYVDAELWIVGEGYYKKSLAGLANRLGLSNNVKFLGKKSHVNLARIYNEADIFVLANYQETTPAVNEAMACAKPVVVMECGGCEFAIPNANCGIISKRFDVDDMVEKIIFLLNNRGYAEKMANKGRRYIVENFSIEKVALKIFQSFVD